MNCSFNARVTILFIISIIIIMILTLQNRENGARWEHKSETKFVLFSRTDSLHAVEKAFSLPAPILGIVLDSAWRACPILQYAHQQCERRFLSTGYPGRAYLANACVGAIRYLSVYSDMEKIVVYDIIWFRPILRNFGAKDFFGITSQRQRRLCKQKKLGRWNFQVSRFQSKSVSEHTWCRTFDNLL